MRRGVKGVWFILVTFLFFATPTTSSAQEQVEVGDRVEFRVADRESLSGKEEVRSDGLLEVPGTDGLRVPAAGRSLEDVRADVLTILESLFGDVELELRVSDGDSPEPVPSEAEGEAREGFGALTLVPGGPQFASDRTGRGILTVAGVGAALGVGLFSDRTETLCAAPEDPCSSENILEQESDRPYLVHGIAGAVVVTGLSYLEARRGRDREDRSASVRVGPSGGGDWAFGVTYRTNVF